MNAHVLLDHEIEKSQSLVGKEFIPVYTFGDALLTAGTRSDEILTCSADIYRAMRKTSVDRAAMRDVAIIFPLGLIWVAERKSGCC